MTVAHLVVECHHPLGPLRRIWAAIGFDELNYAATARGRALLRTLHEALAGPYSVRNHNALTTSNGLAAPAWGGGNVYHEDVAGKPHYFWSYLDAVYDAILAGGGVPLVELGFMPRDLARASAGDPGFDVGADVGREPYELAGWKYPPRDWARWGALVFTLVRHLVDRYGADTVAGWRFEVWNEPDLPNYWRGTFDEYCALYDHAAAAVKLALPEAQIGGPATTHHHPDFLVRFLEHVTRGRNHATGGIGAPLDFLSFHTKGAAFRPRRHCNPFVPVPEASPSTALIVESIHRALRAAASFPTLRGIPCLVDECDPAVGTIYGVFDNPNFVINNTAYYPTFVCALTRRLLDLEPVTADGQPGWPRVDAFTTWAFFFEGKRWFEGNRVLVTNENVELPIMNGLRLLSRLGPTRLSLSSSARTEPVAPPECAPAEVDGLAARDGDRVTILIWHHADRWQARGEAMVELTIKGLAATSAPMHLYHWRVDADHSNAHGAWLRLGQPAEPTPAQIATLKARMGLELLEPPRPLTVDEGTARLRFSLPLHAVSCLELAPGAIPATG